MKLSRNVNQFDKNRVAFFILKELASLICQNKAWKNEIQIKYINIG